MVKIIGREAALTPLTADLHTLPGQPSHWMTICGRGGTGKSLVLNEMQRRARDVFAADTVSQPLCVLLDMQQTDLLFIEGLLNTLVNRLRAELRDPDAGHFRAYEDAMHAFIHIQFEHPFSESLPMLLDRVYDAFLRGYHQVIAQHRVLLLVDTMQTFDEHQALLKENGLYDFFQRRFLTLPGTTFVLAGQSHRQSGGYQAYGWYQEQGGLSPQYLENDQPIHPAPETVQSLVFEYFTPAQIESYLEHHLSGSSDLQRLLRAISLRIQPRPDGGETELTAVLKHPLKLMLFTDRLLRSGDLNIRSLDRSREELEFILVQNYYELNGLSDVVMYMALKDDRFDAYDLARIMAVEPRVAQQKLKALRQRDFVKILPDGSYRLHTDMRHLINEHLWQAFDSRHRQRDRLYEILLARYQEQLIEVQEKLKHQIHLLQSRRSLPRTGLLYRTLETPDVTLEQLLLPDRWEQISPFGRYDTHQPDVSKRQQIRTWTQRWTLELQEKELVKVMSRRAAALDFCADVHFQLDIFELEWFVMRYHQPQALPDLVDQTIAKTRTCERWMEDENAIDTEPVREANFRLVYRKIRTLEQQRRYVEAAEQYTGWINRIANTDSVSDIQRRIWLLARFAIARLRQPDTPINAGQAALEEAYALCQQYPHIDEARASIEAKRAWLYHLNGDYRAAADAYQLSIDLLANLVGPRRQRNLFVWLTQWGYVQRYDNPFLGIELAEIAYRYLLRDRHHVGVTQALQALASLYRRSGSYESSFRCALYAYTTARQARRADLEALALLEMALTRWVAVIPATGTDDGRDYIQQPEIPPEIHANLDWSLQRLQEAQHRLESQQDDAIMQVEYARLLHLLAHANIAAGNEESARDYLKKCYRVAERIDDQRRIRAALVTDMQLNIRFASDMTLEKLLDFPAYRILMNQAERVGNLYGLGRAHQLTAMLSQQEAILNDDDQLFEITIEQVCLAYHFLAQQAGYGVINIGDDWRLFEKAVRELEASALPHERKVQIITGWCQQLRTYLDQPGHAHIRQKYPQLDAVLSLIEAHYDPVPDTVPVTDAPEQVDQLLAQGSVAAAWRIAKRPHGDPRLRLRQVEILTLLECFDEARERLHALIDDLSRADVALTRTEMQRMVLHETVLMQVHLGGSGETLSQLTAAIQDMLVLLDQAVDDHIAAMTCTYLADTLQQAGYASASLQYYQRASRLFRRLNQPLHVARTWLHISGCYAEAGDHSLAIWYADQATALMDRYQNPSGVVAGHIALGIAYRAWAVKAALHGAPGTMQNHYQRARHYFNSALRLAEQHACPRAIPEIYQQLALTLFHESELIQHSSMPYTRILEEALDYLTQAEAFYQSDNRRRIQRIPRRKRAQLHRLRGQIIHAFANRAADQNESSWEDHARDARKFFDEALSLARACNHLTITTAVTLSLAEMRYVRTWSHPQPTPEYRRLALETNLYDYFHQSTEPYFSAISDMRANFAQVPEDLLQRLGFTDAYPPDGLLHYFGRIEILLANVASWNNRHQAVRTHLQQAGHYFARANCAIYNVRQMLHQLRQFLDDRRVMPAEISEALYHHWQQDEAVSRVLPEALALCHAYQLIPDQSHADQTLDFRGIDLTD